MSSLLSTTLDPTFQCIINSLCENNDLPDIIKELKKLCEDEETTEKDMEEIVFRVKRTLEIMNDSRVFLYYQICKNLLNKTPYGNLMED
jgi:hypothetical protein